MNRRRDELDAAARQAQQSRESRQWAEATLEAKRQESAETQSLAERLQALNESNGFAELLFDAVIRGSR